jgi:hypothetical protein
LQPEKCEFEKMWIEYLGLVISENQVEMDPVKVAGAGMMVKYDEYTWSADLKIAPSTMEPANSAEL